jgi:uncharacterized membrane protein
MSYPSPHKKLFEFLKRIWLLYAQRGIAWAVVVGMLTVVASNPAAADFRLCNNTSSRVGVAVGYRDYNAWVTTGWWNLGPDECGTLLPGKLPTRYFYVHAIDYGGGGEWLGKVFMCTSNAEFTIRGTEDCSARGHDRNGFFEVDTRDQSDWTVQLDESTGTRSIPDRLNTDAPRRGPIQ